MAALPSASMGSSSTDRQFGQACSNEVISSVYPNEMEEAEMEEEGDDQQPCRDGIG